MTGQIVIKSSSAATNRRKPLLTKTLTPSQTPPKKSSSNVGEVAGVTAANCFVVCCCCPCVLVEFVILAVYKVPVNLCRRVWRTRRRKIMMKKRRKNGILEGAKEGRSGGSEVYYKAGFVDELTDKHRKEFEMIKISVDGSTVELDQKMWEQFHDTGFWRSSSRRNS
ncbi:hypothetical protein SOVF_096130 [Spinacia oleracea]|uniref:Uncharacterized protein n=1 Tax=Spinacia oleracea TaxID=3562 RepID=A0A9R0HXI6_SPIOL|nr:uncharacterized protein LOC110778496 [Spinacia oleracea]KNA15664.1 hypothetical protein SOVF_096130 [Spinacia oleracea]